MEFTQDEEKILHKGEEIATAKDLNQAKIIVAALNLFRKHCGQEKQKVEWTWEENKTRKALAKLGEKES